MQNEVSCEDSTPHLTGEKGWAQSKNMASAYPIYYICI